MMGKPTSAGGTWSKATLLCEGHSFVIPGIPDVPGGDKTAAG